MEQYVLQVLSDNRIWELQRIYSAIENMRILNQNGRTSDRDLIPTSANNFEPRYQNSVRQALRQLKGEKIERVSRGLVRLISNIDAISEFEENDLDNPNDLNEDELENEFEEDQLKISINKVDVERRAVEIVTHWLEDRKWTVKSVEKEKNRGYDLLCKRGDLTRFIEVKGKNGQDQSFFITKNELKKAKDEPKFFYIFIVTSALSDHPLIHFYSGRKLQERFDFEPLLYAARLKDII